MGNDEDERIYPLDLRGSAIGVYCGTRSPPADFGLGHLLQFDQAFLDFFTAYFEPCSS